MDLVLAAVSTRWVYLVTLIWCQYMHLLPQMSVDLAFIFRALQFCIRT
jgi:hypothetical protein